MSVAPPPLTLPNGKPKPKPGDAFKGCLIMVVGGAFFVIVLAYGCSKSTSTPVSTSVSSKSDPAQPANPQTITKPNLGTPITADQLFNAYDENEVSADEAYKGTHLLITGRVGSINKDFMDKPYLTLPAKANMFMGVHAELADSERGTASYLRKGQRVTMSCICAGKILTDVVVNECTIHP